MISRTSYVNDLNIHNVSFSSIVEIGDSDQIHSLTKAFAVQREKELFFGQEEIFSSPIFQESIPLPVIDNCVHVNFQQNNPFIKVNRIKVEGISFSSTLQIGSNQSIYLESRVKHVRHLTNGYK